MLKPFLQPTFLILDLIRGQLSPLRGSYVKDPCTRWSAKGAVSTLHIAVALINQGAPQGSILEPILYTLYVKDFNAPLIQCQPVISNSAKVKTRRSGRRFLHNK